jgi:hypothetical protein
MKTKSSTVVLSESQLLILSRVYDIFLGLSPGIILTASCEAIR